MKFRHLFLGIAILIAAAMIAGVGVYLKYNILKPLDIYQDKSIFELPFLMHSDEYLQFVVEYADELLYTPGDTQPDNTDPRPTQPSTTAPQHTEPPATQPTGTSPATTAPNQSVTQPTPGTTGSQPQQTDPKPTTTTPPTTSVPVTTVPPTTVPDLPSGPPDFYFPDGVDESWFDNVLFIGDSRTVGLKNYARSGNADYFCDVGMSVFNYKEKKLSDKNFAAQTLETLLSSKSYDKIFINLGLNEIGYPSVSLNAAYKKLVDMVRQKQPDATIILQGVMSVTEKKASTASYFSVESIGNLNKNIKALANGKDIFYIDCNEYLTDADGYLHTSLTNDGYHPTGTGYAVWRNWIHWAVDQM